VPCLRRPIAYALWWSLVSVACSSQAPGPQPDCDVLFAGGRIVDGSGAPAFLGDVCVRGDRIAAMGTLGNRAAVRRVDATGLVVSPGFIDLLGQSEYLIYLDNRAASKITQGITTEITGEGSLGSAAHRNARQLTARKAYYDEH
jgi:N-acyl-D-amino-acid deacylase